MTVPPPPPARLPPRMPHAPAIAPACSTRPRAPALELARAPISPPGIPPATKPRPLPSPSPSTALPCVMAGSADAPPPIPHRHIRVRAVILPPPTASQSPPTPNYAPCPRPRKGQRPVEVARAVAVRGERVVATHERNRGGRRSSGRWRWPSEWARWRRPVQEEHDGNGVLLGEVEEVVDVSRTSPPTRCPLPSVSGMAQLTSI
eukprot:XP_020406649.1 proline-rich protein 36-like [Zea mays]